jgi:hypothetical protein
VKEFAVRLGGAKQPAKGGLDKLEIVLFASLSGKAGRKGFVWIPSAQPVNKSRSGYFQIHSVDTQRTKENRKVPCIVTSRPP